MGECITGSNEFCTTFTCMYVTKHFKGRIVICKANKVMKGQLCYALVGTNVTVFMCSVCSKAIYDSLGYNQMKGNLNQKRREKNKI